MRLLGIAWERSAELLAVWRLRPTRREVLHQESERLSKVRIGNPGVSDISTSYQVDGAGEVFARSLPCPIHVLGLQKDLPMS
jgi:hypothetical protein